MCVYTCICPPNGRYPHRQVTHAVRGVTWAADQVSVGDAIDGIAMALMVRLFN